MTRARILADYVSGGTTAAEFDYMDGVTSNVQTQLDAKVTNATHTGDVTGGTALTIATDAVDIAMLSATGTADGTTFLRGDNAWAAAGGGKVLQVVTDLGVAGTVYTNSTTNLDNGIIADPVVSICPASTSNKILLFGQTQLRASSDYIYVSFRRIISGGATTNNIPGHGNGLLQVGGGQDGWSDGRHWTLIHHLDSPGTESEVQYNMTFRNDNNSTVVTAGNYSTLTAIELEF